MACLQGVVKYSANVSVPLLLEYLTHRYKCKYKMKKRGAVWRWCWEQVLLCEVYNSELVESMSSLTIYLHFAAVQSETLVHDDRFVLWPQSWVPGTMAAALSWQSPSIFSTWRGPSGWTTSCDKRQLSSTGIFLGMLFCLPNIMSNHISDSHYPCRF